MGTIEKGFFQIVICVSLLIVHLMFIILDVNIYQYYSFLSPVITFMVIFMFGAIVLSDMDTTIKNIRNKLLIKKYQKILSSFSFWGIFIVFTLLAYIDAYSLGQPFLPADQVTKLFLPELGEWFIYLPFLFAITIVITHFLKEEITTQANK